MNRILLAAGCAVLAVGLAACGSSSSSSSSTAASSSAAASDGTGGALADVCAQVDRTMTDDLAGQPSDASLQTAITDLTAINDTAGPEGQAALQPIIAALQGLVGTNLTGATPPPEYQAFMTSATAFKDTCTKAGVTFTATPTASPTASPAAS